MRSADGLNLEVARFTRSNAAPEVPAYAAAA